MKFLPRSVIIQVLFVAIALTSLAHGIRKIGHVTDETFEDKLAAAGDKLVLINFSAIWCGPCKILAANLRVIINEEPDVVFLRLDIDENMNIPVKYGVRGIPTTMLFKNSESVATKVGAISEQELKDFIAAQSD